MTPIEALEIIKNASTIYVGCASNIYTRYSYECKIIESALNDYKILKREHEFLREHYNELLRDYLELKGQK